MYHIKSAPKNSVRTVICASNKLGVLKLQFAIFGQRVRDSFVDIIFYKMPACAWPQSLLIVR